ncbi:hypothetical protein M0811_10995 [Anaeramoeba ignava]|uniref:Uncharacterized protein n=1 Tax=Anaeramoeba ignava TaxID=1746090 RepID=A0A9Q0R7S4_ANAIG|nr:hypothetical protein M0811_10995 [Anaeramoeba ignava]
MQNQNKIQFQTIPQNLFESNEKTFKFFPQRISEQKPEEIKQIQIQNENQIEIENENENEIEIEIENEFNEELNKTSLNFPMFRIGIDDYNLVCRFMRTESKQEIQKEWNELKKRVNKISKKKNKRAIKNNFKLN